MKQYQKDKLQYAAIKAQLFIGTFGLVMGLLMAGGDSDSITQVIATSFFGWIIFMVSIFYILFIINKYELDRGEDD